MKGREGRGKKKRKKVKRKGACKVKVHVLPGRTVTELNIPGVKFEVLKRTYDTAVQLFVQDLCLVDRLQTFRAFHSGLSIPGFPFWAFHSGLSILGFPFRAFHSGFVSRLWGNIETKPRYEVSLLPCIQALSLFGKRKESGPRLSLLVFSRALVLYCVRVSKA